MRLRNLSRSLQSLPMVLNFYPNNSVSSSCCTTCISSLPPSHPTPSPLSPSQISAGLYGDMTPSLLAKLSVLLINLSLLSNQLFTPLRSSWRKTKQIQRIVEMDSKELTILSFYRRRKMFVRAHDPGSFDRLCRLFLASILTLIWKIPCGKRKMTTVT